MFLPTDNWGCGADVLSRDLVYIWVKANSCVVFCCDFLLFCCFYGLTLFKFLFVLKYGYGLLAKTVMISILCTNTTFQNLISQASFLSDPYWSLSDNGGMRKMVALWASWYSPLRLVGLADTCVPFSSSLTKLQHSSVVSFLLLRFS